MPVKFMDESHVRIDVIVLMAATGANIVLILQKSSLKIFSLRSSCAGGVHWTRKRGFPRRAPACRIPSPPRRRHRGSRRRRPPPARCRHAATPSRAARFRRVSLCKPFVKVVKKLLPGCCQHPGSVMRDICAAGKQGTKKHTGYFTSVQR